MNQPPHLAAPEELLHQLGSDAARGLGPDEAQKRLEQHGPNRLPEPKPGSPLLQFLQQFTSPLVLVLVAAALVATVVGFTDKRADASLLARFADALAILGIVLLNAVLGHVQEHRAATAMAALRRLSAPNCRVLRGGVWRQLPAEQVVPGDVMALTAGDAVAADARLLEAADLTADESTLTGESMPVRKSLRLKSRSQTSGDVSAPVPTQSSTDVPLAEQSTMVFLGTTIARGDGRALVVRTGGATELGRIGKLLADLTEEETPLEKDLRLFGRKILWICLVASALLFAWGLLAAREAWHALLLQAVSFAVAAIPEGLPAITTIALALGTQRMARRGVIVRKLAAIESLGAASVICTDKTGTLTQNQMTVRMLFVAGQRYEVSGEGYAPHGTFTDEGGTSLAINALPSSVQQLFLTAVLCNNASLSEDKAAGRWSIVGDPTEGALLVLAQKGGLARAAIATRHPRLRELPFDSDRRRMTVVAQAADRPEVAYVKGCLDELLPRSSQLVTADGIRDITDEDRARVRSHAESLGEARMRILALAYREAPPPDGEEIGLTFLGLVGMLDPPREGVKEAIATCREAAIHVVMITGDHPLTAQAIGHQIGLLVPGDEVMTGRQLDELGDDALQQRIGRTRIFARTTAEQKLRIVHALKKTGQVVAMTGDGVNDAPALREAHVGIAMGKDGTDVARQAAGIVITDDNFATIVAGIREGRAIYSNIQKFIFYLLSSNAALTFAVFAAALFPAGLPLTPLMVLVINLVTNGLPALALGVDPPDPKQMTEPPRVPGRGLFSLPLYLAMLYVGLVMGAPVVLLYYWTPPWSAVVPEWSRAMAFVLLGFGPLFHAWNCHSPLRSLFSQRPLFRLALVGACLISAVLHGAFILVPALRDIVHAYPISGRDWLLATVLAASVIPAIELSKALLRLFYKPRPAPRIAAVA